MDTTIGTLKNAVYGAVVGDALGVPYEFMTRDRFECTKMTGYGTHFQPPGTWSDDSSLMLATCKSIKDNNGKIVIKDIQAKFADWLLQGKYSPFGDVFDVGNTTRLAILTGESQEDERSNGNGSLMRILPLAFIDCTDEEIRQVSAITHGHWISMEACVIFVNMIRECLSRNSTGIRRSLADVVHSLELPEPFDRLHRIDELERDDINSSGYVVSTLEAAVWCVLRSNDLKECLLMAVNLGYDTDTVAAVAGGLAAACRFSIADLPKEWLDEIKNRDVINDCLF